jgi:putative permease
MRFLEIIGSWINRHFSNEEAIYLLAMLGAAALLLFTLGDVLAPVLTGLVIAFLLEGLVSRMTALRIPDLVAVTIAFVLFVGGVVTALVFVVPLVGRQTQSLLVSLPDLMVRAREIAGEIAGRFPELGIRLSPGNTSEAPAMRSLLLLFLGLPIPLVILIALLT